MSQLIQLPNDTKVRFCNAMDRLIWHKDGDGCEQCKAYTLKGDGDLCEKGKDIIAQELAYAETHPLFQKERVIE